MSQPASQPECLFPTSIDELKEAVLSTAHLLPAGGATKWIRRESSSPIIPVSLSDFKGIVEYQPDEYTITARAGTPIRELTAALAKNGQYLPFDPPFISEGATLGVNRLLAAIGKTDQGILFTGIVKSLEMLRLPPVVAVQKSDIPSNGLGQTCIAGRTRPGIVLWEILHWLIKIRDNLCSIVS